MCGLVFRWVLSRFSDRGLVVRGRHFLGLFNQLYWVVFGAFCCNTILIFTVVPFVRGNFEDSIPGRECVLQPKETNNIGSNRVMIQNTIHLVFSDYALMLKFKVFRYFSGVYPKGHMAAIGRYNRNLIGFNKNCWLIFVTGGPILLMTFTNVSLKVHFWIQNGGGLSFKWFFIGLVLPLSMKIPWKVQTKEKVSDFYVQKPDFPNMHYFPQYCPAAPPPSPLLDQILHSSSIWTTNIDSNNSTIQALTILNTPALIMSPVPPSPRVKFPSARKIQVKPAIPISSIT